MDLAAFGSILAGAARPICAGGTLGLLYPKGKPSASWRIRPMNQLVHRLMLGSTSEFAAAGCTNAEVKRLAQDRAVFQRSEKFLSW